MGFGKRFIKAHFFSYAHKFFAKILDLVVQLGYLHIVEMNNLAAGSDRWGWLCESDDILKHMSKPLNHGISRIANNRTAICIVLTSIVPPHSPHGDICSFASSGAYSWSTGRKSKEGIPSSPASLMSNSAGEWVCEDANVFGT